MHRASRLLASRLLAWLLFTIFAIKVRGNELRMRFLNPETSLTNTNVLRIGTALTLSAESKFSTLGGALKNSYMMYFDWLNNHHGGVRVGSETYLVELILVDDMSDKGSVSRITDYLVDTLGLRILLAPYSSGLTAGAAAKANATQSLLVAPGASLTSVFKDRPTVFGTLPVSSKYLSGAFKVLGSADSGAKKTLAMVQEDQKTTKAWCSRVPGLATANNMDMLPNSIFTVPPDVGEGQVKDIVRNLTILAPDIVAMCTYRIPCHALLKEMRSQRFYAKAIMATVCVTESDFMDVLGTAGHYVLGVTPWTPELPLTSSLAPGWTAGSFAAEYQFRYGKWPPYQAASAFSACAILVWAIEAANSSEPLLIADQLNKAKQASIYGTVAFDGNGQITNEMKLVQFQGQGAATLVYPHENSNGEFAYPKPSWADMECSSLDAGLKSRYGLASGRCVECALGRHSDIVISSAGDPQRLCVKCPTGKRGADRGYKFCFDCPSGSYSDIEGADQCSACGLGSFQNSTGQSRCYSCGPGQIAQKAGSRECQDCPRGTKQPLVNQSACVPCEVGHYNNLSAQTSCMTCPGVTTLRPHTTKFPGAKMFEECKCPAGTYEGAVADGSCSKCPGGMLCDSGVSIKHFGNASFVQPVVLKGYWSSPSDPMKMYRCNPAATCPGGAINSCTDNRIGITCGTCPAGSLMVGCACKQCTGVSQLAAVFFLLVLVACPWLLHPIVTRSLHWALYPKHAQFLTMKVIIVVLQIMGLLTLMTIEWPTDMVSFVADIQLRPKYGKESPAMAISSFGAAGIAACILGSSGDVVRYAIVVAVIPVFMGVAWCTYPVAKCLLPAKWKWKCHDTWNMTGLVFSTLFLTQLTMSMVPLVCYKHPFPNSDKSLLLFSATICGSDDHSVMLMVGITSLLTCLSFIAYIVYSLYVAPLRLSQPGAHQFLSSIAYMMDDFRLEYYYFLVPLKLQDLLLASVLVAFPDEPHLQCVASSFIFVISLAVACKFWPLKSPAMNLVTTFVASMLILIVCVVQATLPEGSKEETFFAGYAIACIASILYLGMVGTSAVGVTNVCVHGPKGTLLWLAQLQATPDLIGISAYWEYASRLNAAEFKAVLQGWQIYDINSCFRILKAIAPEGVADGLRSKSARASALGVQVQLGTDSQTSAASEGSAYVEDFVVEVQAYAAAAVRRRDYMETTLSLSSEKLGNMGPLSESETFRQAERQVSESQELEIIEGVAELRVAPKVLSSEQFEKVSLKKVLSSQSALSDESKLLSSLLCSTTCTLSAETEIASEGSPGVCRRHDQVVEEDPCSMWSHETLDAFSGAGSQQVDTSVSEEQVELEFVCSIDASHDEQESYCEESI